MGEPTKSSGRTARVQQMGLKTSGTHQGQKRKNIRTGKITSNQKTLKGKHKKTY